METNVVTILSDCPLFSGLSEGSFKRLAAIAQIRRFNKGRSIFRQGDECPGVFVVGSGLVRVFKKGGGKEHVLHMVGPGQTFAEVAAIGGFECPANAEAVSSTVCALLPLDRLQKALAEDHDLCLGMLKSLTLWVRHLVGLMEDIVLRDASGRLARYLLDATADEAGQIALPTLRRYVASHLNLTSETFSRTLRRLTDAGLIAQSAANRIRLVDRKKLRAVAEGLFPKL
ncbi:MAG TPA: Crp/Fnr family transcriptional regulator [Thermoguttaceae bacterium]|nr:Crp/Fnr family transcriptional regulator [Thermoguttaceae bacterium]